MVWLREDGGFLLDAPKSLLVGLFGDVADCESHCESDRQSAKATSINQRTAAMKVLAEDPGTPVLNIRSFTHNDQYQSHLGTLNRKEPESSFDVQVVVELRSEVILCTYFSRLRLAVSELVFVCCTWIGLLYEFDGEGY